VRPDYLEWQHGSGGNCCYHMPTLQWLHVSKPLLILSKYKKHVAVRKWNILFKIYFAWGQAVTKKIQPLIINSFRTFGETRVSEQLRFCARSWRRFFYVLLLELLLRSFIVFNVSYIVESLNNILKTFVKFRVLCTNCTVSKICIFILKVNTKLSNNGESSLLFCVP